jgi:hypothetical protein
MVSGMTEDDDQKQVAALLASMPPPDVPGDFVSRVSARIDQSEGWFGVADFRAWTLRLAPVAAGLGLIAVLWPGAAAGTTSSSPSTVTASADFSPTSATDWQQEVSADALLAAALTRADNGR